MATKPEAVYGIQNHHQLSRGIAGWNQNRIHNLSSWARGRRQRSGPGTASDLCAFAGNRTEACLLQPASVYECGVGFSCRNSRHLLIYSTAGGTGFSQIYLTDLDGAGLRAVTHSRALEVEAKANPKTG